MSHRKNQNYSDIQSGETLFDFLKRKKRFSLEQSLSKSARNKQNVRKGNNQSAMNSYSPKKNYEPDHGKESTDRFQTTRRINELVATPKKYPNEQESRKQTVRGSFIEMISPHRRRAHERSKTPDQRTSVTKSKQPQKIDQLNNTINNFKNTFSKVMSTGHSLKQKAHPLLSVIQEGPNRNYSKKAEDIRLKLRSFEHLLNDFTLENGNALVEEFNRNFSQHLISLEGNIRTSFEKDEMVAFKKIKEEYQNKLTQMEKGQQKMERQIDALNRKLEKSEKAAEKLRQLSNHQSSNHSETLSNKILGFEQKISYYENELSRKNIELNLQKQRERQLEKEVKDAKYMKEEAEKKFIEENTKIKSTKEKFLLDEISMIKKQFKNDMNQLNTLYSSKQQESLMIIEQLRKEVADLHFQRSCDKETESKILADCSNYKGLTEKYKKQNQCLVTDLHRMNEELYQHWLALKDIKTLSCRLGCFNKFSKIYEDLIYNDQLFL